MENRPLQERLFSLQEETFQQFLRNSVPDIDPQTIIGVRTPKLRRLAREVEDRETFLSQLPHRYFEENQLHCFLLERERDFATAVARVQAFLPYVDNWATCDQLRPKVFAKNRRELLPYIRLWLASEHPYTVRFGIGMLMCHYLDGDFDPMYPQWVSEVPMEHYYVKMMAAWYFATALAKQYDAVLPYITKNRLEKWVHNKTIQKAVESFRIPPERKEVLKQHRMGRL